MNYNFWGLDITMCFGKDCPIKNDCIRYVAKPEKYQSYFEESPYNDGKCFIWFDYGNRLERSLWDQSFYSNADSLFGSSDRVSYSRRKLGMVSVRRSLGNFSDGHDY